MEKMTVCLAWKLPTKIYLERKFVKVIWFCFSKNAGNSFISNQNILVCYTFLRVSRLKRNNVNYCSFEINTHVKPEHSSDVNYQATL